MLILLVTFSFFQNQLVYLITSYERSQNIGSYKVCWWNDAEKNRFSQVQLRSWDNLYNQKSKQNIIGGKREKVDKTLSVQGLIRLTRQYSKTQVNFPNIVSSISTPHWSNILLLEIPNKEQKWYGPKGKIDSRLLF